MGDRRQLQTFVRMPSDGDCAQEDNPVEIVLMEVSIPGCVRAGLRPRTRLCPDGTSTPVWQPRNVHRLIACCTPRRGAASRHKRVEQERFVAPVVKRRSPELPTRLQIRYGTARRRSVAGCSALARLMKQWGFGRISVQERHDLGPGHDAGRNLKQAGTGQY